MVDSLSLFDSLQHVRHFVTAGGGDDRNRLADRLLGQVSKDPFSTLVPTGDHTVEIFADDRVIRRFDD